MDLYEKIAKEEEVDLDLVKRISRQFEYLEIPESDFEMLIKNAIQKNKNFLKMEASNLNSVPNLPKGANICPVVHSYLKGGLSGKN